MGAEALGAGIVGAEDFGAILSSESNGLLSTEVRCEDTHGKN